MSDLSTTTPPPDPRLAQIRTITNDWGVIAEHHRTDPKSKHTRELLLLCQKQINDVLDQKPSTTPADEE